ncbi:MAG TPA: hypothetical protein PKW49_13095, partial [Paludibacteraceae bacterium]|nr:hypothetical protein [Paludibacteraceae bacterium]HQF51187.1 hypothetical protein [Paludibacteraceae bacterium]
NFGEYSCRYTNPTYPLILFWGLFRVFYDGHIGNKKAYKLLTCRLLYCYCLVLSRPFSGERGR